MPFIEILLLLVKNIIFFFFYKVYIIHIASQTFYVTGRP